MVEGKEFCVLELDDLAWPDQLILPTTRFRLLIAADISEITNEAMDAFALSALENGMAYCCCWGPDCEKSHDIVDATIIKDETRGKRFRGPNPKDVILTTWHKNESLEETLEFFATLTNPSDGLLPDSNFWLAIVINNRDWAATARKFLEGA